MCSTNGASISAQAFLRGVSLCGGTGILRMVFRSFGSASTGFSCLNFGLVLVLASSSSESMSIFSIGKLCGRLGFRKYGDLKFKKVSLQEIMSHFRSRQNHE